MVAAHPDPASLVPAEPVVTDEQAATLIGKLSVDVADHEVRTVGGGPEYARERNDKTKIQSLETALKETKAQLQSTKAHFAEQNVEAITREKADAAKMQQAKVAAAEKAQDNEVK